MPIIYHDLELIQLRMPRTGSTSLMRLLTRASGRVERPDAYHHPMEHNDAEFFAEKGYNVWATRRDFHDWAASIEKVRSGPAPHFGMFTPWKGMHEAYHATKRCGDEYYRAYNFLYARLVAPASGVVPTAALPPLDDRDASEFPGSP